MRDHFPRWNKLAQFSPSDTAIKKVLTFKPFGGAATPHISSSPSLTSGSSPACLISSRCILTTCPFVPHVHRFAHGPRPMENIARCICQQLPPLVPLRPRGMPLWASQIVLCLVRRKDITTAMRPRGVLLRGSQKVLHPMMTRRCLHPEAWKRPMKKGMKSRLGRRDCATNAGDSRGGEVRRGG